LEQIPLLSNKSVANKAIFKQKIKGKEIAANQKKVFLDFSK